MRGRPSSWFGRLRYGFVDLLLRDFLLAALVAALVGGVLLVVEARQEDARLERELKANLASAIATKGDLSGLVLAGQNLDGLTISRTDLVATNLAGASLVEADLSVSTMYRVVLVDADLRNADLRRARLANGQMSNADLSGADLSGADLEGARFVGASLAGSHLVFADLTSSDFSGADLSEADLTGAFWSTEAGVAPIWPTGADFVPPTNGLEEHFGRLEVGSGGCLISPAGESGRLAVVECEGTSPTEWAFSPFGEIVNRSGLCLDVQGPSSRDGTTIQSFRCDVVPQQQWTHQAGRLVGLAGKCVQAQGSSSGEPLDVTLQSCDDDPAGQWEFVPAP